LPPDHRSGQSKKIRVPGLDGTPYC
jgi:hypothetical protein